MLSKNKIKQINSLKIKKYRKQENAFICEGEKIFDSLVKSDFNTKEVFATADFIKNNTSKYQNIQFNEVDENKLSKISSQTSPQNIIAIVEIPTNNIIISDFKTKLTLVLDKLQDPGNLGTIIRIADWFGIKNIICSLDSVDVYNTKVVQATMGSIFNVNIFYQNLEDFLQHITKNKLPIYGTFLNGENIYTSNLEKNGIIVMGNEANGINTKIEKFITKKITIPEFNKNKTAESLNVAVSTAIICSEFVRR
ncbi:MAG: RNA methyltransferase [Candidatus Cloacimonadota bacterium]|nr:RNA methyltransferase [Candidatus Cloacimonadota bacterium]